MNPDDPIPAPDSADALGDAALHAFGVLSADAARAFEARVDADRTLEAELEACRAVVGDLALLAPASAPPADLLHRVLLRVREPMRPSTPFAAVIQDARVEGKRFVLGGDGGFVPLRVEGVTARTLHRDAAAGYATVLVRMAPGASYPAHRHADDEECYVLEGDLQVGEQDMVAGDYQLAPRGSLHPVQSTRGGCLLLLRSSLHDELVQAG